MTHVKALVFMFVTVWHLSVQMGISSVVRSSIHHVAYVTTRL
jgi:hypothetical protein